MGRQWKGWKLIRGPRRKWRRYVDLLKLKKDQKGHRGRSGKLLCRPMQGLKDIVGPTVQLVQ